MREQMAKRDAILSMNPEAREKSCHPIVEAELAFAHQHHNRDAGREDLRERGEIKNRIELGVARLGYQCAITERTLKYDIGAAPDRHRSAGKDVSLDGVLECPLYFTPSQANTSGLSGEKILARHERIRQRSGFNSIQTGFENRQSLRGGIEARANAEGQGEIVRIVPRVNAE